jgi:hypothetical protein
MIQQTRCELAKIASKRTKVPPNVFSRDIYEPSVMIDESLEPCPGTKTPSATELEAMQIKGRGMRPHQLRIGRPHTLNISFEESYPSIMMRPDD